MAAGAWARAPGRGGGGGHGPVEEQAFGGAGGLGGAGAGGRAAVGLTSAAGGSRALPPPPRVPLPWGSLRWVLPEGPLAGRFGRGGGGRSRAPQGSGPRAGHWRGSVPSGCPMNP